MIHTYTPLHSAKAEQALLHESWTSVGVWPHKMRNGKQRRFFPDLGLLQQPLNEVRDYFGEKIAFYFAWMEHYSEALLVLMGFGTILYVIHIRKVLP